MSAVENALGPLFLLIALGAVFGWRDYPGGDFWARAEGLVYYVLFPALLVHTLAGADIATIAIARLSIVLLGGLLIAAALLVGVRRRVTDDAAAFTSIFQGSLRPNTYVAIAGASALHGAAGITAAAVAIMVLIPAVNILSVLCFVFSGTLGPTGVFRSLREVGRNPLILACGLGIALETTGIGLPGWIEPALGLMGHAALPLALLMIGVALRPRVLVSGGRAFWIASLSKLVVLPALVLLLATLFDLRGPTRDIAILFAAVPTATSAYILARRLGGDSELMATLITGQTVLAVGTLPLWLSLF